MIRRRRVNLVAMLALLLLVGMMSGCEASQNAKIAQRAVEDYFAGNYPGAARQLEPLAHKPDENYVLNNLRLGSTELVQYDLDGAQDAFLRAYEVINTAGVQGAGRSIGAAVMSENIKIWKGEPYERAMANFYLGLTYYMQHDYANARGAFENALFKLRDYASPEAAKNGNYTEAESNFVIANLMLARCWQKMGRDDLAQANFEQILKASPQLSELADAKKNADANLVLVVEFGHGPQKVTDFDGSIVGFAPTPGQAGVLPSPRVVIDGKSHSVPALGEAPIDLLAMAQDRRWQSIDTIRVVKSGIGTGLIAGGAGYGLYRAGTSDHFRAEDAAITAGLIGAGLLLKGTSQADVRQWEMLPRTIFILPMKVNPGTHDLTVAFPQADDLKQTWRNIVVPDSGEATYYIRMIRWNEGPFDWPPPAVAPSPPQQQRDEGVASTQATPQATPQATR